MSGRTRAKRSGRMPPGEQPKDADEKDVGSGEAEPSLDVERKEELEIFAVDSPPRIVVDLGRDKVVRDGLKVLHRGGDGQRRGGD